ncbi:MAG: hypothetical protein AVO33_03710 [delta proteobacterium ML8_F1]|nr:MAG: hypothetical protein AVO33_03710 [delta proteobacterium ML8_F1]
MRPHEIIADKALSLGFHQVGFSRVAVFENLREIFEARDFLEMEIKDSQKRIDPWSHFPGGGTFVVLGMSYPLYGIPPLHGDRVRVSASLVPDYHLVLREKLEELLDFVITELGGEGRTFVDVEGLDDRQVAFRSGLGFYGKNTQIISPYLGSNFNIGYLVLSLELDYQSPVITGDCRDCTRCVEACPTGALPGDYTLTAQKCLSYLTQKKDLSPQEASWLNRCVYGCDICQRVCPYNSISSQSIEHVFTREDFEALSQRQYKKKYGHRDFSFRGVKIIRRNIDLALGNSGSETE